MNCYRIRQASGPVLCLLLLFFTRPVFGHGGVVLEEDRCVINIGFLTAHFTVYQPETRASEEFCEDIPDVTASVFVMEYLHDFLREMPVDFRIIRDLNEVGEFARWEDVEAIDDLESVTVFYQSPSIEANANYTAEYAFQEKGTYIGIVTAQHPDQERQYNAVFFFQVGGPDLGTLPLFIALLVALQLGYWLFDGGWARLMKRTTGMVAN
jgi:hypothetical protein